MIRYLRKRNADVRTLQQCFVKLWLGQKKGQSLIVNKVLTFATSLRWLRTCALKFAGKFTS